MKQIKTILLTILMIGAALLLPGCSGKASAEDYHHCCCCEKEVITEVIDTPAIEEAPVEKEVVYKWDISVGVQFYGENKSVHITEHITTDSWASAPNYFVEENFCIIITSWKFHYSYETDDSITLSYQVGSWEWFYID